jgi:membrane associated rhomboid family serine protease
MNAYRQSPFANITPVVKNLLIINVIFFVATLALGSRLDMVTWLSAYYFNSPLFHPWQIITYMFMHGGWAHIFFNMFALFIFGPTLEYTMGSKRFLQYYFITGVGALLLQWFVQAIEVHNIVGTFIIPHGDPTPYGDYPDYQKLLEIYGGAVLGASGAIFGLLLAFGVLFPNVELMILFIPIPIKAKYAVTGYILIELFSGIGQFSGDNVAHFAHLGGALFGFILLKIWRMQKPNNNFY